MQAMVNEVEKGLSKLDASERSKMDATATLTFADHFAYQTIQSEAFASGRISQEVATFLYQTLGSSADSFNRKPLALRLTCVLGISTIAHY